MKTDAPTYVLTAMDKDEDKDKQIARLQAMNDEKEQVAKKANDDKEKLEAQYEEDVKTAVKAIIASEGHDGRQIPVVRAKLQAMHDEEHDEAKKAAIKAALEVFDEGNGDQVNNKTQVGNQDEPKQKVEVAKLIASAIKPFEDKLGKPIIAQILKANVSAGASQEQIETLQKSLTAKSYSDLEKYYNENQVLIASNLQKEFSEQSLTASFENNMPFNGETPQALVGNMVSIDKTLENVVQ